MKKAITLMIAGAILAICAIGAAQGASPPIDSKVKIDVSCGTLSSDMETVANYESAELTKAFTPQKRFCEIRMEASEVLSHGVGILRQDRRLSFYRWRQEKPNYYATIQFKRHIFVRSTNFQNGVLPLRT